MRSETKWLKIFQSQTSEAENSHGRWNCSSILRTRDYIHARMPVTPFMLREFIVQHRTKINSNNAKYIRTYMYIGLRIHYITK